MCKNGLFNLWNVRPTDLGAILLRHQRHFTTKAPDAGDTDSDDSSSQQGDHAVEAATEPQEWEGSESSSWNPSEEEAEELAQGEKAQDSGDSISSPRDKEAAAVELAVIRTACIDVISLVGQTAVRHLPK